MSICQVCGGDHEDPDWCEGRPDQPQTDKGATFEGNTFEGNTAGYIEMGGPSNMIIKDNRFLPMPADKALEHVREMQRRNEQLGAWPTGGPECQAFQNRVNAEALRVVLEMAERYEALSK